MIYVIGPRDKVPEGALRVDTTSRANSTFSPFLNPVSYRGINSKTMENAWQYSKVYKQHDDNGKPNQEWYRWRGKGFESKWADRYPMGKGAIPEYAWIENEGKKLDYVESRKQLYVPLYRKMLDNDEHASDIFILIQIHKKQDIALWDFDGYNTTDDFDTILNNPKKKMGHAFVLREVILEREKMYERNSGHYSHNRD